MGSSRMVLKQIVLLLVWTLWAGCLTDWELDNFGIRTEHHKDDLINKVNLDKNAPKLVRSHKRPRHHRRPPRNQEKTRINFRIRDRDRSQESIENPSVLSRTAQSSPVSSSFLPESNFAASIQHKASFAEFKENFLGSRAVSESASGHWTEEIGNMQPADITGPNQILGETSPPRRRQKVRVRPGLRQAKPSTAPAPTTINTINTTT